MFLLCVVPGICPDMYLNAKTTIKGHIQGIDGKPYGNTALKVEISGDFITYDKTTLVKGKSGKHGDFNVEIDLAKTSYIFVTFGGVQRTFHAEPNKSYYLDIKVPTEGLSNKERTFSKNISSANIINTHKKELNYLIDTLDYACSKFLRSNITERKDEKRVALFIETLLLEFESVKSQYFKDYLHFKEAELMLYCYRDKRSEFALKYFGKEKNIASHIQKMHVFSSFFKGNLRFNILINDRSPFHDKFNAGDLQSCLQLIHGARGCSRELRELLLLQGIYEVHSQEYYKLRKVVTILDKLIATSGFPAHRVIAAHIKSHITHLKESYPAPALDVTGVQGQFKLGLNKQKYLYLCFFNAWDDSFDKEVEIMEMLKDKYKGQLDIVCVSVDQDTTKFGELKRKYNNDILFIHYNFQNEVLFDFNIEEFRLDRYDKESVAKFYLIDPEGYLVFSPAKPPTRGFHKDLQRIMAQ